MFGEPIVDLVSFPSVMVLPGRSSVGDSESQNTAAKYCSTVSLCIVVKEVP